MPAGRISPRFILSKLLSAVTQPMFWLVVWWVLPLLMLKRWRGPAVTMMWGGLAVRWLVKLWIYTDGRASDLAIRQKALYSL